MVIWSLKINIQKIIDILAVINENGLWIKDKIGEQTLIIHSEKIDKNVLKDFSNYKI